MNPIQQLRLQRQIPELMDAVRSILYFGIEPNTQKYLIEFELMITRLTSGDLQAFHAAYLEAIAGVSSDDPAYAEKLAKMESAISNLHGSLQNVLDKIDAIRALNPDLLPNPYAQMQPQS